MQISLDQLQQRLINLGRTLSEQQLKEFREILDGFAQAYYEIGEAYKMAVINLLPSKIASQNQPYDEKKAIESIRAQFKPQQSLQDIAMSLARNLDNQLKKEQK